MSIIVWIITIYCIVSLFTLFNIGIRHLYIEILDKLYERCFIRLNKRNYRVRHRDYVYCVFYCIGDLFIALIYFILAPLIILYNLPTGGYKFRFTPIPYWKLNKPGPTLKQEYVHPPTFINVKKDIPFAPNKKQIIYVEDHYSNELNNYMSNNFDKVCDLFKEKGYTFIYIPKLIESLNIEDAIYLNPTQNKDTIPNNLTSQNIIDIIITSFDTPISINGGLLRYKWEKEEYYIFSYFQFSNLDDVEIWEQCRAYISTVGDGSGILYHLVPIKKEDFADSHFDYETKKIITEISERIDILRQKGINEMILKKLFSIDTVRLSRLIITNEHRIFLPDYDNLEITMHPLPKAVYFLFLNHPEGILFKHLPDYKDELIMIYKKISGRENIEDMEKSIDDVVNPTKNSINEKCSRIREAFVKHFDESIAENYFITGERATPKIIKLDRALIFEE